MGFERHPDHWRWIGGPVPPGANGITLGRLVIVRRKAAGSERLMRHELVHVRQFRELGWVGFARRYLAGYLRARLAGWPHWAAYRRVPLEVEAVWEVRLAERRLRGRGEPGSGG